MCRKLLRTVLYVMRYSYVLFDGGLGQEYDCKSIKIVNIAAANNVIYDQWDRAGRS